MYHTVLRALSFFDIDQRDKYKHLKAGLDSGQRTVCLDNTQQ
jgi:hypothetical protein